MSNRNNRFYAFGPFKLDVRQRVLLRDGLPLPLTLKSVEILLALVENGTRILEKDDLMKRVWPDTFVEEANLTQHISLLRKTLGENPQAPRFIETVPRRGYRFIANVEEVIIEERTQARFVIEESGQELEPPVSRLQAEPAPGIAKGLVRRWRQGRIALSASFLALGLVALAAMGLAWRSYFQHQTALPRPLDFVRLTGSKVGEGGTMLGARFAPHDKRIVFAADWKEGLNLWAIQYEQIGNPIPLQITKGPWRDESPIWSPDGERIAFISNRGDRTGIWSVPSLGGTPILLKTVQEGKGPVKNGGPALKRWARDGTAIFYEQDHDFFALSLTSSEVTQLTHFAAAKRQPRDFCLSANEQSLAYVEERNGQTDLWLLPVGGGEPRRLTQDASVERFPAWHPDNKRLVYSLIRDDQLHMYLAYTDGQDPAPVPAGDKQGYVADITADGTRVLCFVQQDECDLIQVKTGSGEETEVTVEIGMEFWPAVSRNGTSLAFQSTQGIWNPRRSTLLVSSLTPDSQPIQLAGNAFQAQWSPNGERIAFLRSSERRNNLWTVRAVGGEEKQLTMGGVTFGGYTPGPSYSRFETADFTWAPDGSHLAFCSKQGGLSNLWVVAADGSGARQITVNRDPLAQYACPLWSPDGQRIAYLSAPNEAAPQDKQVWSLLVTDLEESTLLFQTTAILRVLGWASNGELIIGTAKNEGLNRALPTQIKLAEVSLGSQIRQLWTIEAGYLANLYLSPDGRNISCVTAQESRDNIWLWPVTGGLGRRLTNNTDKKSYFSSHAWSFDSKMIYYGKQTRLVSLTMAEKFQ